jgi:hypothetical protein
MNHKDKLAAIEMVEKLRADAVQTLLLKAKQKAVSHDWVVDNCVLSSGQILVIADLVTQLQLERQEAERQLDERCDELVAEMTAKDAARDEIERLKRELRSWQDAAEDPR